MLHISTGGVDLAVALENNSSVDALCRLLKKGPKTITMKDYAHMEKFGSLGVNLPRNDEQITTEPGDVILSDGNLLVLYYAPNTWRFTRLGKCRRARQKSCARCLAQATSQQLCTLTKNNC